MNTVKVYDLPTRAFHWLFAILFLISFLVGKFIDDDSRLYVYHMLSGVIMTFLVTLRIIWGLIGTKYAKFSSFKLRPKDLVRYFSSVIAGKTKRELNHNPASSFAAAFMFLASFALTCTGLLMVKGIEKEFFEEIHEIFVFGFLLTVIFHIAGIIFHQLHHQDGMISSMITGKKINVDGQEEIKSQAIIPLVIFIVLILGFVFLLTNNYNKEKQQLTIGTQTLQLGEKDNKKSLEYYNKYYNVEEDENHDED